MRRNIFNILFIFIFIISVNAVSEENADIDLSETVDLFSTSTPEPPKEIDPDSVVIKVNGEGITFGEIQAEMNAQLQRLSGQISQEQVPMIQERLFMDVQNRMINNILLKEAIVSEGIIISDDIINKEIENIQNNLPEGATLSELLASQGSSIADVKIEISQQLSIAELADLKTSHIENSTKDEAFEYYSSNPEAFRTPEEVTASHILIQFSETDSSEQKDLKKDKLADIRKRIINEEITFENAASEHSDCPSGKAEISGSLGVFRKGQMVPEFEIAAFTQEIGEIGDIIETNFGYHVIKVSDHVYESLLTYEESEENIINYLSIQKKQKAFADYIKSLRDVAIIENI